MPTPAKHVGKVVRSFVYDGDWKRAMPSKPPSSKLKATKKDEATFSEVVKLIAASKQKAFQAVNTTLIDLYWKIGATISRKIETAEWGDGVVERLAQFIARTEPGLRGFTRRNLFRMYQVSRRRMRLRPEMGSGSAFCRIQTILCGAARSRTLGGHP